MTGFFIKDPEAVRIKKARAWLAQFLTTHFDGPYGRECKCKSEEKEKCELCEMRDLIRIADTELIRRRDKPQDAV